MAHVEDGAEALVALGQVLVDRVQRRGLEQVDHHRGGEHVHQAAAHARRRVLFAYDEFRVPAQAAQPAGGSAAAPEDPLLPAKCSRLSASARQRRRPQDGSWRDSSKSGRGFGRRLHSVTRDPSSRHRRLWLRRPVRRAGAGGRPGQRDRARSHQSPSVPAPALPGRDRQPFGAGRGRADPPHPRRPEQRHGDLRGGDAHRHGAPEGDPRRRRRDRLRPPDRRQPARPTTISATTAGPRMRRA